MAAMLVLSGCDTNGDDDGNGGGGGGNQPDVQVGDVLAGGFEVTYVDPAGGYIAKRLFNANPGAEEDDGTDNTADGEDGGALIEEVQVLVEGQFNEDLTFEANTQASAEDDAFVQANADVGGAEEVLQIVYYLGGAVFIGDNNDAGNTLTVEEGALIRGTESSTAPGLLVITRGSKINAVGTASNPIVFTSAAGKYDSGSGDDSTAATYEPDRAPEDWGGIVINGYGVIQGGEATGEGGTGAYGGNQPDDDSGTLQYVRVEFAGTNFTPDNELNGIAFQGVGSGTTVDHIQVHQNGDDGVEFFGGNVAVSNVVLSLNEDDSLDHDDGWNGSAQYVVIYQSSQGDHAIEGDGDDADDVDPAQPVLANFTWYTEDDWDGQDSGFYFRRAAQPDIYNSVLINGDGDFSDDMIEDDGAGTIEFAGVVISEDKVTSTDWDNAVGSDGNQVSADALSSLESTTPGDAGFLRYASDPFSGAAQDVPAQDPAGNELDQDGDNFVGAVGYGATNWWDGWVAFPAE
jgi:hypothetical protein